MVKRLEEVGEPGNVGIALRVVFEALDETLGEAERKQPDDEEFGSWWRRMQMRRGSGGAC